ncbi:MAG: ankyrin repeat domain-containing protein [Thiolinea sp.]
MTPNFKTQLMACVVFVACSAPVANAGLLEDFAAMFNLVPQSPKPAAENIPEAEPEKTVVVKPDASVKTVPAEGATVKADQPTVQAQSQSTGKPSQKELDEMLWLAALQGNDGRIRGLVEQGANPASGTKHGETPLHVAASRGHLKPIIYLANHGGSVNARTDNGWTPLHHAARFGHLQAVKYLLHMGAIPHIRTNDKGRKSPMEMAVDNGYIDIALLFGYRPK